jgi:hypothetical protein
MHRWIAVSLLRSATASFQVCLMRSVTLLFLRRFVAHDRRSFYCSGISFWDFA